VTRCIASPISDLAAVSVNTGRPLSRLA
jgi:hypothetical protein